MGMVWSGWDLPGQEAAFSLHAYFIMFNLSVIRSGKSCSGTALSHKQCGSIVVW